MGNSVSELENLGFGIVEPVKKKSVKENKPKIVPVIPPQNQDHHTAHQIERNNNLMQSAIAKIAESLKALDKTPKKLVCENIERDEQGLMTSFEISVIK